MARKPYTSYSVIAQRQWNGFGARLAKARALRGLTLQEVAEKVGCTRQNVSQNEKMRAGPTLMTVLRYALALNVSVGWLAAGELGADIK